MILFERRASVVLYHLLRSLRDSRPFLLPANVCPIVPETFRAAGRDFELVDIAMSSLTMDSAQTLRLLRQNDDAFAGVLFVRTYGSDEDPTPLFSTLRAAQSDLIIIDDRCLCRPDCDGTSSSALADVTLFSTGYAKYVDRGAGGFAHVRDDIRYEHHAGAPDWLDFASSDESWSEYRDATEIAAAASDDQKFTLNSVYETMLPREIQLPAKLQRWRFNIRVPDPDGLITKIFAAGLFASRHYASLDPSPNATRLHSEIVNLFNDRYFDAERARRVCEIVLRHLDEIA